MYITVCLYTTVLFSIVPFRRVCFVSAMPMLLQHVQYSKYSTRTNSNVRVFSGAASVIVWVGVCLFFLSFRTSQVPNMGKMTYSSIFSEEKKSENPNHTDVSDVCLDATTSCRCNDHASRVPM
jgi:hypothetical protein